MQIDPEFPWSVDIPIPEHGNQNRILVILDAASTCKGGAKVTTFGEPPTAEIKRWFNRVSTRSPEDADRIASQFRTIGARRVI